MPTMKGQAIRHDSQGGEDGVRPRPAACKTWQVGTKGRAWVRSQRSEKEGKTQQEEQGQGSERQDRGQIGAMTGHDRWRNQQGR